MHGIALLFSVLFESNLFSILKINSHVFSFDFLFANHFLSVAALHARGLINLRVLFYSPERAPGESVYSLSRRQRAEQQLAPQTK